MPKAKPRRANDGAASIDWRQQAFFWTGAVVVFGLFLFVFSDILLPFIAGNGVKDRRRKEDL